MGVQDRVGVRRSPHSATLRGRSSAQGVVVTVVSGALGAEVVGAGALDGVGLGGEVVVVGAVGLGGRVVLVVCEVVVGRGGRVVVGAVADGRGGRVVVGAGAVVVVVVVGTGTATGTPFGVAPCQGGRQ